MEDSAQSTIVSEFGQIVGIEKARSLVSEAAKMTDIPTSGPYTADEKIQLCTIIENQESDVVANTAHEIRSQTEIKKHFQELFGVLPDPAMIVAQQYSSVSVITANENAEAVFNFEKRASEDTELGAVVNPVDHDKFEKQVYRKLANDQQLREQVTVQNGTTARHFIARFSAIEGDQFLSNGGSQTRATPRTKQGVLVFTDITEQKSRQREIEQLQQITGVLNRVLRHNLRNSMTKILGTVDSLEQTAEDEETVESLAMIDETSTKLLEISENARLIEDCVREVETKEMDIVPVVRDHLETYNEEYAEAEIRTDLPHEAPALADKHIHNLLENAIRNGIEHNDKEQPVLEITIDADPADEVILEIADNGPGIPESELAVVDRGFESPLEHGAGLGIWLISWLTRQYGGDVSFENRTPEGTRILVRLPRPE